jgi:hypothetical protein
VGAAVPEAAASKEFWVAMMVTNERLASKKKVDQTQEQNAKRGTDRGMTPFNKKWDVIVDTALVRQNF